MALLGVALAGLVIAWWREAAGATITLLAIAIASSLNWRILVSPFALFPVAAALHLLNARLSARSQRRT